MADFKNIQQSMIKLLRLCVMAGIIGIVCIQAVFAQSSSSDAPAIKRKFNGLGLIWQDVQSAEPGTDRRKELLAEFLAKSSGYLELVPKGDKTAGQIWTFRAIAACELGQEADAKAAGLRMQELGLDRSESPQIVKTLAYLERKGWLVDPKIEHQKREKAQAEEEQRNSWPRRDGVMDLLRQLQSVAGYSNYCALKQTIGERQDWHKRQDWEKVIKFEVVSNVIAVTTFGVSWGDRQPGESEKSKSWCLIEYRFNPLDLEPKCELLSFTTSKGFEYSKSSGKTLSIRGSVIMKAWVISNYMWDRREPKCDFERKMIPKVRSEIFPTFSPQDAEAWKNSCPTLEDWQKQDAISLPVNDTDAEFVKKTFLLLIENCGRKD